MKKPAQSQTRTRAGKGAEFLTLFCIVWDVVVVKLMFPQSHIPMWFKGIFVFAGVAVTWAALYLWYQRLKGGGVSLTLSHDPLPHGVPVTVEFQVDKSITAGQWLVEAKMESSARNQSGFGTVWSQDFAATTVGGQRVRAEVTFPGDVPSTAASDRDMTYSATLTLRADGLEWAFNLKTRVARAGELQFAPRSTRSIGNKAPAYTPEQVAAVRRRWAPWAYGIFAVVFVVQMASFLDLNLWTRAKAAAGVSGAQSTGVTTEPFDIRVTNYLVNDWALRGRLVGKARVADGVLIVQVQSLDVQPVGACEPDSRVCEVESASLLLAQDGEKNFSTLAHSSPIAINANLREITRWSLPQAQRGVEIRMPLPAAMETDGVRLKLQIRSAGGSTVYPEHGPYLNLHRALANARGAGDPCERIKDQKELVRAGCGERLQGAALQDKDGLLFEALKTENFHTAALLLAAGARADAHSVDEVGRTALGYAAASNDVAMVERLLAAGAQANAARTNEHGQTVTALTQALRTDAVDAVRRLLQAGAQPSTNDPTGWTPMHVAAYESATASVAELVRAGADANERTPAYRQQTALQTAVQFANAATVRAFLRLGADASLKDNQGQNACDWAKFFKRGPEIQTAVCGE